MESFLHTLHNSESNGQLEWNMWAWSFESRRRSPARRFQLTAENAGSQKA